MKNLSRRNFEGVGIFNLHPRIALSDRAIMGTVIVDRWGFRRGDRWVMEAVDFEEGGDYAWGGASSVIGKTCFRSCSYSCGGNQTFFGPSGYIFLCYFLVCLPFFIQHSRYFRPHALTSNH